MLCGCRFGVLRYEVLLSGQPQCFHVLMSPAFDDWSLDRCPETQISIC